MEQTTLEKITETFARTLAEEAAAQSAALRAAILEEAVAQSEETRASVEAALADYGTPQGTENVFSVLHEKARKLVRELVQEAVFKDEPAHTALLSLGTEKLPSVCERLGKSGQDALAEALTKEFLTFADLHRLFDRDIQKVLREVDSCDLVRALKAKEGEDIIVQIKGKVLRNMSRRAGEMLEEDMEFMGPMRESDIMAARQRIANAMNALAQNGEIYFALDEPIYR